MLITEGKKGGCRQRENTNIWKQIKTKDIKSTTGEIKEDKLTERKKMKAYCFMKTFRYSSVAHLHLRQCAIEKLLSSVVSFRSKQNNTDQYPASHRHH